MSGTLTRPASAVRRPTLPHLVGLDGLRAVAVIAVILYHADVPWLPGGFLGVDVFFVISGFLITSLLLVEFDRTGRLDYRGFYVRRARRLLPALLAMLVVSAVLVATVASDVAAGFRHDLPGALLYYSNWLNIVSDTSYFDFIGRPPILKHLWSLALEEQFYLVWPTVALLAYRWRGARAVGQVAALGALLSTVALMTGSLIGSMPAPNDPSRLYFGADTHSMGVLAGAALAVVWRPGRTSPVLAKQAAALVSAAGVAGLLLLGLFFHNVGEFSNFLYRGGFLVVSLVAAVVVAAASHRGVPFGRYLGIRPMRYVGERSYGLYLWHWPIFMVTRPGADIPLSGAAAFTLRIGLLMLVAHASYKYLEVPMRRGALARLWRRFRAGEVARPGRAATVLIVCAALLASFTVFRVATAKAPVMAAAPDAPAAEMLPEEAKLAVVPPPRDALMLAAVSSRGDLEQYRRLLAGDAQARAQADALSAMARQSYGINASAFGDSVLLGAAPALEREAFDLDLHARVAQQAEATVSEVLKQAHAGNLRPVVIVHTGSNGIVTKDQMTRMLEALTGVDRVVVVNTKVPRAWSAPNNKTIASVVAKFPNTRMVDWAAISAGHSDYFVRDGVHLTWTGAQVYSRAIEAAAREG